jgi:polar amino acid transport system substrate-binding protein
VKSLCLLASLCASLLLIAGCADESPQAPIRAAVTPASPPNLYQENGQYKGLDLELFEGYCAARGRQLEIAAYNWQGMLDAVVGGQADVAFSGISITSSRQTIMDFSQPYMENTWNLMSLQERHIEIRELSELKQYRIGYPAGMAYSEFIQAELEPKGHYTLAQVKLYPSYTEVLADLRSGSIDLAFVDGTVASVYRKQYPLRDSYVFSGFDRFGFAFPKGSALRADFDKYLIELGPQGLQAVIDRWLN